MDAELHKLHLEAGRKAGEDRTCGRKKRFADEALANKATASHNKWKKRHHDVEPYPCAFCNQWHVGRVMSLEELRQCTSDV